ncbi:MAG: MBL fold metallo-hydrolase [Candidatus Levybacteria bacterium]|nr:MBL fold metallo-hydrolase [Candidatus Levybacteria bacterium]
MKIIFLGTNGWYTTETGNTPCILIDSKERYVIFDAGNGFYKLDKHITENKPISLFITHFHIDHVSGLHSLPKFTFKQGIDLYLAPERKKDFETLVNPPYTIGHKAQPKNIVNLRMDIRVHQLKEGLNNIPFPVEVIEQFHAYRDHGYRVTLDGKTIAYSGDCGKSGANAPLASNADLLIHECSFIDAQKDIWGHVDPKMAAQIAKENNVKKLILTHFDASKYTTIEKRKNAEKIAKKIFPNTLAATDDMIFEMM